MPIPHPPLASPCGLLSIKGTYVLENEDKGEQKQIVGTLTLTKNPYEVEHFFDNGHKKYNPYNFKLLYKPDGGFPELLLPNGNKDEIESCIETSDGTSYIRYPYKDGKVLKFTSVVVENQDLDYLFKANEILYEEIQRKYNLTQPIYDDLEIMMRHLGIPDEGSTRLQQFCRKLIFPGKYKIYYKNKEGQRGTFIFEDMFFNKVYKPFDRNGNIAYYEIRGLVEDEFGKTSKVFLCKDLAGNSIFYPEEHKSDKLKQKIIFRIDTVKLTPESESWLSRDIYKIKLRENSLCKHLTHNTKYNINSTHGETTLFVGIILGKGFGFSDGYTVIFDNLGGTFISSLVGRSFKNQPLEGCFSSTDGNFLNLKGYKQYKDDKGVYLNKTKKKEYSIKFQTLNRIDK